MDYAGVWVPGAMQGSSFLPILSGETPDDWRKAMYYRFYENAYQIGEHEGVRTMEHKLIHFSYPAEAWELYDLKADPGEMTNLFNQPGQKIIKETLLKKMDSLKMEFDFY